MCNPTQVANCVSSKEVSTLLKYMKKIAIVLLVLTLVACEDNDKENPTAGGEFVWAKRNNVTWSGAADISIDHASDTMTIFGVADRPNDEVLMMRIKFNGVGTYPLVKNQARYYSTVGGDIVVSEYRLASDVAGSLMVLDYDAATKIIQGQFDVQLKKRISVPENNIETFSFTKGVFKGTVRN
jgi:hypothetical protein